MQLAADCLDDLDQYPERDPRPARQDGQYQMHPGVGRSSTRHGDVVNHCCRRGRSSGGPMLGTLQTVPVAQHAGGVRVGVPNWAGLPVRRGL
jgi:hypothetical protein